jgi:glycosyltransferase involved in cell wall biosynthesis
MSTTILDYYTIEDGTPSIGALLMVKDEEKRIHVTLDSIKNYIKALIVYDTGSTDNTVNIIKSFAEKNKINLYLKHGTFTDFAVSRNESLEFAETVPVTYLLLLDCNDELQGGEFLIKTAKQYLNKDNNAFYIGQKWFSGDKTNTYYNLRFIKNRNSFRYFGVVHEYLKDTLSSTDAPRFECPKIKEIVLYQDRTLDGNKSFLRFSRDKELLLNEYKNNPTDTRTLFYLAQTCECLQQYEDALKYSILRLELIGYDEELFHSLLRCGDSCMKLGRDWTESMSWYMKAVEKFSRAEPLVRITDYYKEKQLFNLAYMFIDYACKLKFPENCNLFVDKHIYDYYRWHLMSVIAFYVGEMEKGKSACLKAIEQGVNKELDMKNLNYYNNSEQVSEREVFMRNTINMLKSKFPNIPQQKLLKRATSMWKNKKPK